MDRSERETAAYSSLGGAVTDKTQVMHANGYQAMLFDMDGVITRSASAQGAVWKQVLDEFLQRFYDRHRLPFRPFDADVDYHTFVDGKPRYDGVSSFLASRGIVLPFGEPTDDGETESCCGLGNRKNRLFLEYLDNVGIEVFDSTVKLIRDLRARGKRTAVVTASKNGEIVLRKAGILNLFHVVISGREAAALSLAGKPAPDTYTKAMELLEIAPGHSVAFEDSVTGIQAAKTAGIGLIVGIDRAADGPALRRSGASLVVGDLGDLVVDWDR